jgi:hypothetical protein
MKIETIEECKENILTFANKFKLIFEEEGECGFGRECVGLTKNDKYIAFNPRDSTTYEYIKEFYDEQLTNIAPENAYHKHDCLAVLGRFDDSIRQLSKWVDDLNELNVVIEKYETGATGMQAIFTGEFSYAVRIPKLI